MSKAKLHADSIFGSVIEIASPEDRAAYLDQACQGDVEMRRHLERLLDAHFRAGNFLGGTGPALLATTDQPIAERPGTIIGPYKLLEQIGVGGFGVVFMAEQQQPVRRKVALKVIKPGMDTHQVIARFEAERQALALMDHPNIARVLDAGATASGRPYFVMELVKGLPITEYCDQNQLTPRQRLELFTHVCQAVQHAHQKGIIHRDIKPSNVLVTEHDGTPVVKVIDFGIAKATGQQLTEKTLFTNFAQMVGTPLYMSPEQAGISGLDIDTRSDIYSLGVLLYELLTGSTPFDKERLREASYDEIRRIIREEEPAKPSTRISTLGQASSTVSAQRKSDPQRLKQLLRGDLDWIVMKALEKDRTRRYETANGIARDVERYLQDEPVLACPPSIRYQLQKFVRRNKGPVLAAALVLLALLGGIIGTTWGMVRATFAVADTLAESVEKDKARANAVFERDRAGAALVKTEKARVAEAAERIRAEKALAAEAAQLKRAESALYFHRVTLAYSEWKSYRNARADQLLDECPVELRNWEWRFLKNLCHSDLRTLSGHKVEVYGVAFSPDGLRLASTSGVWGKAEVGEVKVWDLATGRELFSCHGHTHGVASVAFSRDGRWLATGSHDGTARIWDAGTGKPVRTCQVAVLQENWVSSVAFSPDSRRLAMGCYKTVQIVDVMTGENLLILDGHQDQVHGVAFSPDGQRVFSGSRDSTVKLWDVSKGVRGTITAPLFTMRGPQDVRTVAIGPDGRYAAAGGYGSTVKVFDLNTKKEIKTFYGHAWPVRCIDFSPDGRGIASVDNEGRILWWEARSGRELGNFRGHTGHVYAVAFSPEGRRLATGGADKFVKVWDLTGPVTQNSGVLTLGRVYNIALSPDAKRLAMSGGVRGKDHEKFVRILALPISQEVLLLAGHTAGVTGVDFSPDSALLATSSKDRTIILWKMPIGKAIRTLAGHTDDVNCVRFSPDGKQIASASQDSTVRLWDAAEDSFNNVPLLTLKQHKSSVLCLAYHPKGRFLVSGGDDNQMIIWNAQNGEMVGEPVEQTGPVERLAFSPDGKYLAVVLGDMVVRVWEVTVHPDRLELTQTPRVFQGHTNRVFDVAFSPDSQRLASASADWSVKLWDVASGQEILSLNVANADYQASVTFSRDGKYLVWGGSWIMAWDAEPFTARSALAQSRIPQWHDSQAAEAEKERNWFAAAFHLDRLLQRKGSQTALQYSRLGNAQFNQNKLDDAIPAYRKAVAFDANQPRTQLNLGNALFKQNKLDDAIAAYRQAIRVKPDYAEAHCNLGQSLERQGHFTEALAARQRGHELGSRMKGWTYPSAQWVRNCERLVELDKKLAKVLLGEAKAEKAAEQIEFASICQLEARQLYGVSVRFYEEAFKAQPDLESRHRYNAACGAARAGDGEGKDEPAPDEQARARYRKQALDWLRADLARWAKQLENPITVVRAATRQTLEHWKRDSDLASLRDAKSLAKLSEAEREACRRLWAEVEGLLEKAARADPS